MTFDASGLRTAAVGGRPPPPNHRLGVKQRPGGTVPAGTPSPSWREALKRSCLDRARRNRREAVLRSRGLSPRSTDDACSGGGGNASAGADALSFTPLKSAIGGIEGSAVHQQQIQPPAKGDAKTLVEEELRAKGVSVFSTPQPGGSGSAPQYGAAKTLFPPQQMMDHADHEYAISMDEVYGLMKDVEEELQREETRLLEELQAMEQQQIMEQRRMEEQIADFELQTTIQQQQQQQQQTTMIITNDAAAATAVAVSSGSINESVTCPVCNAANLIYTPANVIICPNTDSGRCNLRLDVTCEGLTLGNFRELLCRACSEHAAAGCMGTLRFQTMSHFGMTTLMAGCEQCKASTMIV